MFIVMSKLTSQEKATNELSAKKDIKCTMKHILRNYVQPTLD